MVEDKDEGLASEFRLKAHICISVTKFFIYFGESMSTFDTNDGAYFEGTTLGEWKGSVLLGFF